MSQRPPARKRQINPSHLEPCKGHARRFLVEARTSRRTDTGEHQLEELTSKTVAVFSRPFSVPGFDETLPAGEYEIETELVSPLDHQNPAAWRASVSITLHPRISHPGLVRCLTVSLADLDDARARDKLTGIALSDFLLEEMLADPMIRLVMKADGVSEAYMRRLYSGRRVPRSAFDVPTSKIADEKTGHDESIRAAENEGMPSGPKARSPLRHLRVAEQM